MKIPILNVAVAAAIGVAASVLSVVPADAAPAPHAASPSSARGPVVFAQNDAHSRNTVFAYHRTSSGGLRQVGSYKTGGDGGMLTGAVHDHLASQDSLVFDRRAHLLLAVNAGSNSLTVFRVHGDRLVRKQVVGTGGSFPVSIAARGHRLFVLNARNGGSISGYRLVGHRLVPVSAWHRELHLATTSPANSTEFVNTPAQIGFTPDGARLVVTTKNGGSSVETFRLSDAGPARRPTVSSLPGTIPFAFRFDAAGHLVLTETGPSTVATFRITRTGALHQIDVQATGQAAACWITGVNGVFYSSNTGSASLSAYRIDRAGKLTSLGRTATDEATVDSAASSDGRYLYVQTGAAGLIDSFRIHEDGSLTRTGTTTLPHGIGAEGIVAL